jgi:NADH:ubiquinone oxidoreductase subunit 3 (subunit A)
MNERMSAVFVIIVVVILAIFIILRVLECVVRRDDKKKLRAIYEEANRETQENPLEF